jgi:hypothetical protein
MEARAGVNVAESFTKSAGVLAIVAYASGLVVVNAYLLPYGVSDFNLFRARFVFTGLLVVASLVIATACPLAAFQLVKAVVPRSNARWSIRATQPAGARSRVGFYAIRINQVVVACMFLAAPVVLFGVAFRQDMSGGLSLYLFAAVSGGLILLALAFARGTGKAVGGKRRVLKSRAREQLSYPDWIMYGLLAFFFIPYLYLFATYFAGDVYPQVPEQMGGGRARLAQLLMEHDSVAGVVELGVPMSQSESDTTARLFLIFRGEDYYLVEDPDAGALFVLQSDIISGLRSG